MVGSSSAPLRVQLFVALVVPAGIGLVGLAVMADGVARAALERALGARLQAVAQSAANLVTPRVALLERGDDEARVALRAQAKLSGLRADTSVGRIFVVHAEQPRLLVDTETDTKVGDEYTRAAFDQGEIARALGGTAAASVLFTGPDDRPYKTGYAPLKDAEDHVVGYIGVAAPADYTAAIDALRAQMGGLALIALALLVIGAVWTARRVAVPLSALSTAAAHIGEGELDTPVPTGGPREAEVLGASMQKMAASLRARDEEMQMMLAGIAHEVRNPLGGIELFGGLLKEDLEGDDRQKHVDKILKELGTLSRVVNDFLDFARRREPEPRLVELADLGFEVAQLLERDARARGVSVEIEIPPGLAAHVDPESFKRAVLNVARNAVQAAPEENGRVRLAAARTETQVELTVEDDGAGIPEAQRAQIFQPFFTTKQKGTGLGLALVAKTLDAHGGAVAVDESPLGGARFALRVPAPATDG